MISCTDDLIPTPIDNNTRGVYGDLDRSTLVLNLVKGAQVVIGRGLANLTKGCAGDVTVNSVPPGPTLTEGFDTWLNESAAVSAEGGLIKSI